MGQEMVCKKLWEMVCKRLWEMVCKKLWETVCKSPKDGLQVAKNTVRQWP
jgi:hypothetical protein